MHTDLTLLILILLMWRIWWAPNNASKWQMKFNLAFKGLKLSTLEPHPTRDLPVNNSSIIQLFNVIYFEQQGALVYKKVHKIKKFKYLIIVPLALSLHCVCNLQTCLYSLFQCFEYGDCANTKCTIMSSVLWRPLRRLQAIPPLCSSRTVPPLFS
jgi:hypothetical protein